jgi:hypothetical protein
MTAAVWSDAVTAAQLFAVVDRAKELIAELEADKAALHRSDQ